MVTLILLLLSATLATSKPYFTSSALQSETETDENPAATKNSYYAKLMRERAQTLRRQEIQDRVLAFVHRQYPAVIDPSLLQKAEKLAEFFNNTGGLGTTVERVSYLLPSCDIRQQAAEHDLSATKGGMFLYYSMDSVQPRSGYLLTIASAKLRVLKYPQGEAELVDQCKDKAKFVQLETEEKVRVSVYNLTKPLKKNRSGRRKLLDSQMVSAQSAAFMELDVKAAVRGWLSGVRNLGLLFEVEDSNGDRKSAASYFRPRDCSSAASNEKDSAVPGLATFPILELTVVEIPEDHSMSLVLEKVTPASGNEKNHVNKERTPVTSSNFKAYSEDDLEPFGANEPNTRHQRHQRADIGRHEKRHPSSSFRSPQPISQFDPATVEAQEVYSSEDGDDEKDEKENNQEEQTKNAPLNNPSVSQIISSAPNFSTQVTAKFLY